MVHSVVEYSFSMQIARIRINESTTKDNSVFVLKNLKGLV